MTNMLDFLIRLRTVRKEGIGQPPRSMRDNLEAEHMGPAMHAKLNWVYRERKKRGLFL